MPSLAIQLNRAGDGQAIQLGICGVRVIVRALYQIVLVNRELSRKAKLWIYHSIYFPTLMNFGQ